METKKKKIGISCVREREKEEEEKKWNEGEGGKGGIIQTGKLTQGINLFFPFFLVSGFSG